MTQPIKTIGNGFSVEIPPGGGLPDPLEANVIPRRDTLANLLALSGNEGEIMVPTDAAGLVVQLAAALGGTQLLGTPRVGFASESTVANTTPEVWDVYLNTAFTPKFIALVASSDGQGYAWSMGAVIAGQLLGGGFTNFPQQPGGIAARNGFNFSVVNAAGHTASADDVLSIEDGGLRFNNLASDTDGVNVNLTIIAFG